jgi:hypothetical protein
MLAARGLGLGTVFGGPQRKPLDEIVFYDKWTA